MKKICYFLLIIITSLILSVGMSVQATTIDFGGGKYQVTERTVENNLPFAITHWIDFGQSGLASASDPQVVNILDIPASSDIKVVPWSKLGSSRWNMTTLTSMAEDFEADNPGYRVIAGINGDFFDINGNENLRYATVGVHASLGHIYKSTDTSTTTRDPIGFKNDGSLKPIVGNVSYEKTDKMILTLYNDQDELIDEYEIDVINQAPGVLETAIYYANWNANHTIEAMMAPTGYVISDATYALAFSPSDFYGLGEISHFESRLLGEGEFSIVTDNPLLQVQLQIGLKVRVQYEFSGAFAGIENATGAGRPIIYDGVFQPDTSTFGTTRNPRTMIGSKADGSIVMCVVDGRQTGMTGVAHPEMAAIMKYYGCVDAYNLDGGGSSTMIILQDGEFQVTNTPSEGRERSDSNCLLVVVKTPILQYDFSEITDHSLTINANVVDKNGFQFNDLYVKMNDEYRKVEAGQVTFTNLDSNTSYPLGFYYFEDEEYHDCVIQDVGLTAKKVPTITSVQMIMDQGNIKVYVEFNDPDQALDRKKVTIGDTFQNMIGDMVTFYQYDGELSPFIISYAYDLKNGEGRIDVTLTQVPLQCSLGLFIQMVSDILADEVNQVIFS
ncbi:MAG: phosphodiester glycosidase family protein [Bacilli bacterium]|nr:phosphodiester glycosidase family protein [Bacilli bacterium]